MSALSDIFSEPAQETKAPVAPSTPSETVTQPGPTSGIFNGIASIFGGGTKSAPVAAPKQTAAAPVDKPIKETKQASTLSDIFGDTSPAMPAKSQSTLSDIFNEKPSKDATAKSPNYFATTTPEGATIGFSTDEADTSGKPFFAYRNPGDTATTTDKTRVATTFDPRTPQKMDSGSFTTPRAVANRASLKQAMGGTYSDELDHIIALELAGSNDSSNLQVEPNIPGTNNTATDPLENTLAKQVIAGKISLFDAQTQLAQAKGTKVPWTVDQHKGGGFSDFLNKIWSGVKSISNGIIHSGETTAKSSQPEDPLKQENDRLTALSTDIESQAAQLSKEKSEVNISDKQSVDNFNAKVKDFNSKLNDYKDSVDKYNSASVSSNFDNYVKSGGPTQENIQPKKEEDFLTKYHLAPDYFAKNATTPIGIIENAAKEIAAGAYTSVKTTGENLGKQMIDTGQSFVDLLKFVQSNPQNPLSGGLLKTGTLIAKSGMTALSAVPGISVSTAALDDLANSNNPILSPVAKGINALFGSVNKIPEKIDTWIDKAPLSDTTKQNLKALDDSLTPLIAYALGGKIAHDTYLDLKDQYGAPTSKLLNTKIADIREKMQKTFTDGLQSAVDGWKAIPNKQAGKISIPIPMKKGEAAPESFKGHEDLTTSILDKLVGRTTVSKQYISDLNKGAEIKQPEREAISGVLDQYSEGKDIPVKEFADKVKVELLPLTVKESSHPTFSSSKYKNVSLSDEERETVNDYGERIYESPVPTSAGGIHFSDNTKNYFGHTRIEDMGDKSTRRVIEVQSDLYQKGKIEREGSQARENLAAQESYKKSGMDDINQNDTAKMIKSESERRLRDVSRLEQYSNPTAHFRMVREEIKQAAIDGKTKLQFPTGETAMKIEGLGQTSRWYGTDTEGQYLLEPKDLKIGESVTMDRNEMDSNWIITDVLGDGKFSAVPKDVVPRSFEYMSNGKTRYEANGGQVYLKDGKYTLEDWAKENVNHYKQETFDISGKVDTNNPIYKFYEKDLAKYLNKFGAKRITDNQGVTWNEIDVKPDAANKPVTAFKKSGTFPLFRGPKIEIGQIADLLKDIVPKENIKYVFDENMLKEQKALGRFTALNPNLKPIIDLYNKNGKAYVFAAYHEAYHYLEAKVFAPELLAQLNKETLAIMTKNNHDAYAKLSKEYNTPEKRASEWRANEFAREQMSKNGYTSPLHKVLNVIRAALKRIVEIGKKIVDHISSLPRRQGGSIRVSIGDTEDAFGENAKDFHLSRGEAEAIDNLNVLNPEHSHELNELENKGIELAIRQEALDSNPVKDLTKYVAKSGEFKGTLPEVIPGGKGIFRKKGDSIVTELGFASSEDARDAWDKYAKEKVKYQSDLEKFREQRKNLFAKFKEDALKYSDATTHPAGRYDNEITESNKGVVPPKGRGGLQAPEMEWIKFKDIAALRLGRDTMERNLEKVSGPYADELKDFLIEHVRSNEVDRIHRSNELRKEIREKFKSLGIKINSKEDGLIRLVAENMISPEQLRAATPKWKEVQSAVTYTRNLYDQLLDEWNAMRAKYDYSMVPKRPNYIRHWKDINHWTNIFGFLYADRNLPTAIAGQTEFFRPGKSFTNAELPRTGSQTHPSVIGGLDNYIDSVLRQAYHIDSIQRGRALERYAREAASQNPAIVLPNFVADLAQYTNLMAGKAHTFDRAIESTVGRPIMKFLKSVANQIGRNIISGNISVAMTHLVSIPLNVATVNKPAFIRGMLKTLVTPLLEEPFTHIDGVESSFLTRRYPDNKIMLTKFDKVDKTLGFIFHVTDQFKTKLAVSSKYYELIDKGMSKSEAMAEADKYAGRIVGDYSIGNRPTLMSTQTMHLVAQFQLGVNDAMSVLMHDIPHWEKGNKWKIANRLVQWMIFAYLFNVVYKKIRGSGKGLDPIDASLTIAGLNEEGNGQDFLSRLSLAGKDVAGELPFTSIVFGTFPLATAVGQPGWALLTGQDTSGKPASRVDALKTLASDLISPVGGGGQAKKTIEGLSAFNAGQTSTPTGQLKQPIEKNALNFVKGAVFGKSAFTDTLSTRSESTRLIGLLGSNKSGAIAKQAEDFFQKYKDTDPAEATAAFDDLATKNPALAKRVVTIADEEKQGITQNERYIKQLNVSMGQRAKYIYDKLMSLPSDTERTKLWDDYTSKKIITPQVADQITTLLNKK